MKQHKTHVSILCFVLFTHFLFGQPCSSNTPSFTVNLTGQPDGIWTSPKVIRQGSCCGSFSPDVCIEFNITLDADAVGIVFDIVDGAKPSGALYYQIGCSSPSKVGEPICLPGVGPHRLTFCKPGNNLNTYAIRSLRRPTVVPNISIHALCSQTITATGFIESSTVWNSIYPGNRGDYNNLLSCSKGCSTPSAKNNLGSPAYVDYEVCGKSVHTNLACLANLTVCDTVRVYLLAPFEVSLSSPKIVCANNELQNITTTVSGGKAPYTYKWSNGATTATAAVLPGATYEVTVQDATKCMSITKSVTVPAASILEVAASANPVPCAGINSGSVNLAVSGGIEPYTYKWNDGVTTQNRTALSTGTYIATVTASNGCTKIASATVVAYPTLNVTLTPTNPKCHNSTDGTIISIPSGGLQPFTYSWNNGAATKDITSLSSGAYSVTVTDANGCMVNKSTTLIKPTPINISLTAQSVACFGTATGSVKSSVSGGTAPYSYLWNTTNSSQNLDSVSASSYALTITDANGCIAQASTSVPQTTVFSASLSSITPKCSNSSDGQIIVNPSGGTAPYTYTWNNGSTLQTLNNVSIGDYQVTITDANQCTTNASVSINNPIPLNTVAETTPVRCWGTATGEIRTISTGGKTPYTYKWNNSNTTKDITGLTSGTYTLTVTDANGCTLINTYNIVQPLELSTQANITNVKCNSKSEGSIQIQGEGGTTPYNYVWSTGDTTREIANLNAGIYTLTLTDANGCVLNKNITVTQPDAIGILFSSKPVTCFGTATGSIKTNISGGTTPYSYEWSTKDTTTELNNLSANSYSLTITDANGCKEQAVAAVSQPALLTADVFTINSTCSYTNDSWAYANPIGGTTPYSFKWNDGSTAQSLENIPSGDYTVTVTDANQCTTQAAGTILNPLPITITAQVSPANCFGAVTGSIKTTASGGTMPYYFAWSDGNTTQDIANIVAGTYTISVIDANGCVFSKTDTVSQPDSLSLSLNPIATKCFNSTDGAIQTTVSGGIASYTFIWSNNATSQNIDKINTGDYSLTVTDANGCSISKTANVSQPTPITISLTPQSAKCFGEATGSIKTNVSGGNAPYSFKWSNAATSADLINITTGKYTLTVTDANGCSQQADTSVTQPQSFTATVSTTNTLCSNSHDGKISANPIGGIAPYFFKWNNDSIAQNLMNLSAGDYTVTITDANQCTTQASGSINQPNSITINSQITPANCFGAATGAIKTNALGGTAPFSFNWSNGSNTQDIANLTAGSYTLSVIDANGCTFSKTDTVSQPDSIVLNLNPTATKCFNSVDGAIQASAVGGTAPYSYSWSNNANTQNIDKISAGNYTLTLTDTNGCSISKTTTVSQPIPITISLSPQSAKCFGAATGSIKTSVSGGTTPFTLKWSNGATSTDLINITTGKYTLTVTDANGCYQQADTSVTQPQSFTATVSTTNTLCSNSHDGKISANPIGGIAPYSFKWSNDSIAQNLMNLSAGDYTVTITDANQCTTQANGSINKPNSITINSQITPANCFGAATGAIKTNALGGTAPFSFNWSNGSNTQDIANLVAGTYTISVIDANGCVSSKTDTVSQPDSLSLSLNPTATKCFNSADGAIQATISGGTASYTFIWSNNATSQNIDKLVTGTYTLTVTDAKGCSISKTTTVSQPIPITISLSPQSAKCFGAASGSIKTNVSGGNEPYSFKWSNAATSADLNNIPAGKYTLTVTDANGCTQQADTSVSQPQSFTATVSTVSTLCNNSRDGKLSANPIGGVAPYSFKWSNDSIAQNLMNLSAGDYTVTVTDANQCTTQATGTINTPSKVTIATQVTPTNCFGSTTGSIKTTISGGTTPYSFKWNIGNTTQDIANIVAGSYTLSVIDANGCTFSKTDTVSQPDSLSLSLNPTATKCFNSNDGAIITTVLGGKAPYNFKWSNNSTSQNIDKLVAGTYTLTVTDVSGCSISKTKTISQPTPITISLTPQSVNCFSEATGSIKTNVSGGNAPYSFKWSNAATSADLINITAGKYTLTVTDANGCAQQADTLVSQPAEIQMSLLTTDANCNGASTGKIAINNVTGGTAPFTYKWNNGYITPTIQNLNAGIYALTITDSKGCLAVNKAITINQPSVLINTIKTIPAKCFGQATGSIEVITQGGNAPYTYKWKDGSTNNTLSNIAAGSYSVTIQDTKGCTLTENISISQPSEFKVTLNNIKTIKCFGDTNGQAYAQVKGGQAPYSYIWSNGDKNSSTTKLTANIQSVTVTDAGGCMQTASTFMGNPAKLASSINAKNLLCFNDKSGEIAITTQGGVAPYQYTWSNGSTDSIQKNLNAYTYQVTITDQNQCQLVNTVTLTEPRIALKSDIIVTKDIICNGDKATLTANAQGGVAPYKWQWNNGHIGQTLINLSEGDYSLLTIDANGCQQTSKVSLTEPTKLNATISTRDATCFGTETGSIAIKIEGGVPSYKVTSDITAFTVSSPNLRHIEERLPAGQYSFVIEDAKQCKIQLTAQIKQNPELKLSLKADTTIRLGDSIQLVAYVEGANSPLQYVWSPDKYLSCTNCAKTWVAAHNPTTYFLKITDEYGCTTTDNISINVKKERHVYIPNVFSPNGDGVNDSFKPYFSKEVKRLNVLRIFTRWGEEVFVERDRDAQDTEFQGWNGTYKGQILAPDVFVYYTEIEFVDGETKLFKGDITLMR